jgi:hypothetical protein
MINLILAEYKDGKFERFLKLANAVIDTDCPTNFLGKNKYFEIAFTVDPTFLLGNNAVHMVDPFDEYDTDIFLKDEKDPLNRFNGLFDGSTFEEGRFILIEDSDYQFFNCKANFSDRWSYEDGNSNIFISFEGALCKRYRDRKGFFWRADFPELEVSECIGNIFENPELYEKIK